MAAARISIATSWNARSGSRSSLARIDTVAYVRFASVYKNFQEADDFDRFVSELRPEDAALNPKPDA